MESINWYNSSDSPTSKGTSNFKSFIGREAAEAWAKSVFRNWKNALNASELEAITKYTGSAYGNINAVLRGYDSTFIGNNAKYAEDLANALNKSSIPENIRLYRGTSKDMLGALKNTPVDELVGKGISDKGFLSTSLIPEGQFSGNLVLKIDAPSGTKGAFIGDLSVLPTEVEVLLQKGQNMLIKEATERNGVLELVVEIIN